MMAFGLFATSCLCLVFLFTFTDAGEVCCGEIGCFTDDYPFNHYRLPRCPDEIPTSYEMFTRNNKENGEEFHRNYVPDIFDASRRTVLLIHGYMNDRSSDYLFQIKDAILSVDDYNVIIVGWGGILDYPVAASSTRSVGAEAAFIVDTLADYGASYDTMWCVGFSLGAHACGHVGMRANGYFGRVTGLDPAGPWFEDYDPVSGINPSSAQFVDIIHTMAHNPLVNWGILRTVGHMDFYPNGGDWLQPGCITYYDEIGLDEAANFTTTDDFMGFDTACSHGRSVDYFLASISNDCFVARHECSDPASIPSNCNSCNGGNGCAHMGYRAQGSGDNGVYYLETTGREPYCTN